MQHRQQDADGHALLDRQRQNRERGREDQQKLGPASPPHVAHHADPHETHRDEEEDARQRGGRQVGERLAREQKNAERRPRPKCSAASCDLQPASAATAVEGGLASTGNAPMKPAKRVGRPDADEIPIDVRTFRAIGERRASSPPSAPSPPAQ